MYTYSIYEHISPVGPPFYIPTHNISKIYLELNVMRPHVSLNIIYITRKNQTRHKLKYEMRRFVYPCLSEYNFAGHNNTDSHHSEY